MSELFQGSAIRFYVLFLLSLGTSSLWCPMGSGFFVKPTKTYRTIRCQQFMTMGLGVIIFYSLTLQIILIYGQCFWCKIQTVIYLFYGLWWRTIYKAETKLALGGIFHIDKVIPHVL